MIDIEEIVNISDWMKNKKYEIRADVELLSSNGLYGDSTLNFGLFFNKKKENKLVYQFNFGTLNNGNK